jgi:hypothetical protein
MSNLHELFPYIVGVLLSLVFAYFPGVKTWYEAQSGKKQLILLGITLAVALAYFGLGCTPLAVKLGIQVACTWDGAWMVAAAFFKIVIASQTTYVLTDKK